MSSSSDSYLISHPHQSLERHLLSVDEVSRLALEAKILSPDFFPEVEVEAIRRVLVYFHDFGKACAIFQHRIIRAARRENPELNGLNHDYVRKFRRRSDLSELKNMGEDRELRSHAILGAFVAQTAIDGLSDLFRLQLLEVIARHHGNLRNFVNAHDRSSEAYDHLLRTQWALTDHPDFRRLLAATGLSYDSDLERVISRYDSDYFDDVYDDVLDENTSLLPYLQTLFLFSLLLAGDKGDMMLADRERVGMVTRFRPDTIDIYKRLEFGSQPTTEINRLREAVYERVQQQVEANADAGFFSITLPTGLGKTLTAYHAAIRLQNLSADRRGKNGGTSVPRIIYCLPFTSVIDQNAEVFESILERNGYSDGLLAKHHYLADWPSRAERTDGRTDENELRYSEKEYLVEGWEYSITITTFVQLLETIFSNRNRALRKFHNLANAIVILDEVQNIPAEYFEVVAAQLEYLHRYMGTRFILVTATQPFLFSGDQPVLELTDPEQQYTRSIFERMNRIDLDLTLWKNGPDELEALIEVFKIALDREAERSFLFIFNKVRESQAAFQELRTHVGPKGEFIYLSSAVLPILRRERIQRIGRLRKQGKRVIVVSTQVVEAGVDIDLDVVYRAFAPLDSINQSAGRCNRHGERGRGSVRVFKSPAGGNRIYDDVLLRQTERVLDRAIGQNGLNLVLPEREFYAINQQYAAAVRRNVAEGHPLSRKLLKNMYRLYFEDVEKDFRLINKTYPTYSVFIDAPDELPTVWYKGEELTSRQVWNRMRVILEDPLLDRWKKKERLRLLRSKILAYVVQFPVDKLPAHLAEDAEEQTFVYLSDSGVNDYRQCYDLTFGYFQPEATQESQVLNF